MIGRARCNLTKESDVTGEYISIKVWALGRGDWCPDGIGRAFADALARRRINLVIVARRRERLLAVAQELSQKHGVATEILDLDLAKRGAIEAFDNATAALDVGVLIAAAGFGTRVIF